MKKAWRCPTCRRWTDRGTSDIGMSDSKVVGWLKCGDGHEFYVEELDQVRREEKRQEKLMAERKEREGRSFRLTAKDERLIRTLWQNDL